MQKSITKSEIKYTHSSLNSGFNSLSWQGIGLLLVSTATLCFEINLTRLFSVGQFYHFAFMVVSIALLGFCASGTFLALIKTRAEQFEERTFAWLVITIPQITPVGFLMGIPFPAGLAWMRSGQEKRIAQVNAGWSRGSGR